LLVRSGFTKKLEPNFSKISDGRAERGVRGGIPPACACLKPSPVRIKTAKEPEKNRLGLYFSQKQTFLFALAPPSRARAFLPVYVIKNF